MEFSLHTELTTASDWKIKGWLEEPSFYTHEFPKYHKYCNALCHV